MLEKRQTRDATEHSNFDHGPCCKGTDADEAVSKISTEFPEALVTKVLIDQDVGDDMTTKRVRVYHDASNRVVEIPRTESRLLNEQLRSVEIFDITV